jgi:uncharacterized membrane protein
VLLVAATYGLGRRLFGAAPGLLAALLAALSPFGVYYSQEARMYIFVALWGALSMLAFIACRSAWPGWAAGLAAGAALLAEQRAGVYSHYFGFSILLAQNLAFLVWWLADWRREGPRWDAVARWAALEATIAWPTCPGSWPPGLRCTTGRR